MIGPPGLPKFGRRVFSFAPQNQADATASQRLEMGNRALPGGVLAHFSHHMAFDFARGDPSFGFGAALDQRAGQPGLAGRPDRHPDLLRPERRRDFSGRRWRRGSPVRPHGLPLRCRDRRRECGASRKGGRMERISQSPLAIYQAHLDKGELAYQWSPEASRAVFFPRADLPVHRQRPARMAGQRRARHGLCDDGHPSARGRPLQRRADRLRRGLPADEPGRGHRARGGARSACGSGSASIGPAATSRPIRSSPRWRARDGRAAARRRGDRRRRRNPISARSPRR